MKLEMEAVIFLRKMLILYAEMAIIDSGMVIVICSKNSQLQVLRTLRTRLQWTFPMFEIIDFIPNV